MCFYLCEMGFQPTGPHICGMDGWCRGGGCADVNGCADHVCASGDDTEATCLDLPPPSQGFECQCTAGYEQRPTGVCENIDECFGNTCQSADDFGAVCVDAAPGEQASRRRRIGGGAVRQRHDLAVGGFLARWRRERANEVDVPCTNFLRSRSTLTARVPDAL